LPQVWQKEVLGFRFGLSRLLYVAAHEALQNFGFDVDFPHCLHLFFLAFSALYKKKCCREQKDLGCFLISDGLLSNGDLQYSQ